MLIACKHHRFNLRTAMATRPWQPNLPLRPGKTFSEQICKYLTYPRCIRSLRPQVDSHQRILSGLQQELEARAGELQKEIAARTKEVEEQQRAAVVSGRLG